MSTEVQGFEDLEQPYPGRRKPVNRGGAKQAAVDTQIWDDHPVTYKVGGVEQEFFLIRHLAKALGYSVQSIRAWETAGLMPRPGKRSPRPGGKPPAQGTRTGRRLWTREQIECILRVANKHKVILNRKPPTRAFAVEVGQEFEKLLG